MKKLNYLSLVPFFMAICLGVSCAQADKSSQSRVVKPAETDAKSFNQNNHSNEYRLSDSSKLIPIKNGFYKNQAGYLYQKTAAQTSSDKVTFKPYFNGMIPQDIDPYTFEQIGDSWYAKDKNHIYLYRPVSGGMMISPINQADLTSFNVINYNYAVDKNHFYHESEIIQNFIPQQTQQIKNAKNEVIALKMGEQTYALE